MWKTRTYFNSVVNRVECGGDWTENFRVYSRLIWQVYWVTIQELVKAANALTLGDTMQWTAPTFQEVCLNCEINSYASATL